MKEIQIEQKKYIFNLQESALAHAISAERIFGGDDDFFDKNQAGKMLRFNTPGYFYPIIGMMMYGDEFVSTRESYKKRLLSYGEIFDGDFAYAIPFDLWIAAVKETATNLPRVIDSWKEPSIFRGPNSQS